MRNNEFVDQFGGAWQEAKAECDRENEARLGFRPFSAQDIPVPPIEPEIYVSIPGENGNISAAGDHGNTRCRHTDLYRKLRSREPTNVG